MKNLKTIERARREKREEDIHNNDIYEVPVMLGLREPVKNVLADFAR